MFPLGVHGSLCCNPQAYSSAIPFSANSFKQQAHRVLVGHSLLMEGLDLLLFCGIALHVKIIAFSPRLTTFHASGVPCLTMFCASVAPRLTTKLLKGSHLSLVLNEHFEEAGESVFSAACQLGCEGIVSKRLGSPDRSGRSPNWVKVKYPKAPAVRREAEEDWGSPHWIKNRKKRAVTREAGTLLDQ